MAGEQAIRLDMWGHPKHIVGVLQPFSLGQAIMFVCGCLLWLMLIFSGPFPPLVIIR